MNQRNESFDCGSKLGVDTDHVGFLVAYTVVGLVLILCPIDTERDRDQKRPDFENRPLVFLSL